MFGYAILPSLLGKVGHSLSSARSSAAAMGCPIGPASYASSPRTLVEYRLRKSLDLAPAGDVGLLAISPSVMDNADGDGCQDRGPRCSRSLWPASHRDDDNREAFAALRTRARRVYNGRSIHDDGGISYCISSSKTSRPLFHNPLHHQNTIPKPFTTTETFKMVQISTLITAVAAFTPLASAALCTRDREWCGSHLQIMGK